MKEALIDDKIAAEEEVDLFTTDYLVTKGLALTVAEAKAIASKVRDAFTQENKHSYKRQLGEVLDVADGLKRKMQVCRSTKDRRVEDFVEKGLLRDIAKRLSAVDQAWECPDKKVAAQQQGIKKKEEGREKKKGMAGLLENTLFAPGFDWSYITMIKKGIRDNPELVLQTVATYLQSSGWLSKDMIPMSQMAVKYLTTNPEYLEYIITSIDYAENFFESESGKRMVKVAPQLMTASTEEALEIFAREADYNQEAFFNLMANGDVAEGFMKQVARFFINSFQWAKKMLDDDLKFALMNGMLISNKFPPINRKNLLKSFVDLAEKLIRLFTTYRAETNLYQEVKVIADEFERLYFRIEDLERLSEKEVETVLSRFLQENIFGPVKDAWLVHRHVVAADERCAPQLACLFNRRHRGSNEIVRTVAKGLTTVMAGSWTAAFTEEEGVSAERIEEAKFHGQQEGTDCDGFTPKPLGPGDKPVEDCDVLKRQDQQVQQQQQQQHMDLSYDHTEL